MNNTNKTHLAFSLGEQGLNNSLNGGYSTELLSDYFYTTDISHFLNLLELIMYLRQVP